LVFIPILPHVSRSYLLSFLLFSACHPVERNPQLDTGIVGAVWMTLDELKNQLVHVALVIKAKMLAGQKYPLSLIYEHPFSPSLTSHLDA
jgi:hypothetical protein